METILISKGRNYIMLLPDEILRQSGIKGYVKIIRTKEGFLIKPGRKKPRIIYTPARQRF